MGKFRANFVCLVVVLSVSVLSAVSDDAAAMNALKNEISGLNWAGPDMCNWGQGQVQCDSGKRVTSIHIGEQSLQGTLPKELAELTALQSFWCDGNKLSGAFPYMPKSLQSLRINNNQFTSMPDDFFRNMSYLEEVSIAYNAFSPWTVPESLQDCTSLRSFSGINASFIGTIPDFFGHSGPFTGLVNLALSFNMFEGGLPVSFSGSSMEILWVNGQTSNNKLNGTLAVLQNMTSLKEIWVHGNSFTGPTPDFSNHVQLSDVSLRDNQLTGVVPQSLIDLPGLQRVNLTNNYLQGPPPKFKDGVSVDNDMDRGRNRFCTKQVGETCSLVVDVLLSVAEPLGYPLKLAKSWEGNDPCGSNGWVGVVCDPSHNVTVVMFSNMGLSGTISPSFAILTTVMELHLAGNNLTGTIPRELTTMRALRKLDVSNNHLYGQVPKFRKDVVVITSGNPDIGKDQPPPPGVL